MKLSIHNGNFIHNSIEMKSVLSSKPSHFYGLQYWMVQIQICFTNNSFNCTCGSATMIGGVFGGGGAEGGGARSPPTSVAPLELLLSPHRIFGH